MRALVYLGADRMALREEPEAAPRAADEVVMRVEAAGICGSDQKQLLLKLDSSHILTAIYIFSALLLWPFAHPSRLFALDGLHWGLLAYCAINTLVAYGAFAEALAHWQASRVSAILATTPLLCLLGAVVAALTVGIRRSGMILALLALPLFLPVLVFGAGSVMAAAQGLDSWLGALLLLGAGLALALVLAPLAAAAAIRIALS